MTYEGQREYGCISNGILLTGGGKVLLNLPFSVIIDTLQKLSTMTASRQKRNGIADLVLEGKYTDHNNNSDQDQDQDTFGITRMDIFRQKKDVPNDTPILTESRFMLIGKEKEE